METENLESQNNESNKNQEDQVEEKKTENRQLENELSAIDKLELILISGAKKAQEKGIKIENGKFFSLSRSGLQINGCCLFGAAHLSLGDENKTKELSKHQSEKCFQNEILSQLRKELLINYSVLDLVDVIEGFDFPDYQYSSPSQFLLLGQKLYKEIVTI